MKWTAVCLLGLSLLARTNAAEDSSSDLIAEYSDNSSQPETNRSSSIRGSAGDLLECVSWIAVVADRREGISVLVVRSSDIAAGLQLGIGLFRQARPDVAAARQSIVGEAGRQPVVDRHVGRDTVDVEAHPLGVVPVHGEHRRDDADRLHSDGRPRLPAIQSYLSAAAWPHRFLSLARLNRRNLAQSSEPGSRRHRRYRW